MANIYAKVAFVGLDEAATANHVVVNATYLVPEATLSSSVSFEVPDTSDRAGVDTALKAAVATDATEKGGVSHTADDVVIL